MQPTQTFAPSFKPMTLNLTIFPENKQNLEQYRVYVSKLYNIKRWFIVVSQNFLAK